MLFRGKNIDPLRLWADYCDIKDSDGPFLPLCFCPNPDHDNSKSPAFQINIEQPTVHCFSYCGIQGSYEHAVALIEGIYDKNGVTEKDLKIAKTRPSLGESVDVRVSRSKVSKSRREAKKIIFKKAASFSVPDSNNRNRSNKLRVKKSSNNIPNRAELTEEILGNYSYLPKQALSYLSERGIEHFSVTRWQLGFNEETERITIPVRDSRGRLKFIIQRGIYKAQHPAYLYPDDSAKSSLLYGACNLKPDLLSSQGLIVVEGSLDCIRLHQHGYANTVAILGNSLSRKQLLEIVRLNPKCVYLFLDYDAAGVRGIEKAGTMLKNKYPVKVPLYPSKYGGNLDPAKLTAKQVQVALGKAIPLLRLETKLRKLRKEFATN